MSEPPTTHETPHATSDGLWRWLLGGLAGGGVILGLLVAAYAIGYHRGQHHAHAAASVAAATSVATTSTAATTTTGATTAPSGTTGRVAVTPAVVARGKSLYASDGCSSCHSLDGSAGAGPTLEGLAGSTVTLGDGTTVTADDAYLARSITDPDAQVVKGYQPGIMSAAIAGYGLGAKPDDVRALVAFIKSQQ